MSCPVCGSRVINGSCPNYGYRGKEYSYLKEDSINRDKDGYTENEDNDDYKNLMIAVVWTMSIFALFFSVMLI